MATTFEAGAVQHLCDLEEFDNRVRRTLSQYFEIWPGHVVEDASPK
jgi:hypothetical protein